MKIGDGDIFIQGLAVRCFGFLQDGRLPEHGKTVPVLQDKVIGDQFIDSVRLDRLISDPDVADPAGLESPRSFGADMPADQL